MTVSEPKNPDETPTEADTPEADAPEADTAQADAAETGAAETDAAETDAAETEVIEPAPADAEGQPDTIVVLEPTPPPKRRGLIAAIIVVGIIVVLSIAAVIAESLARQQAAALIADEVRSALQLEPDHPVDVTIEGASVLWQAASGRLDRVTAEADDVAFGELVGDLSLIVEDTPLDVTQPTGSVQAVYRVAESDVAAIAGFLAGTVVNDVQLDEREIRFQTAFSFFGIEFSVGLGLTPSVQDGQLAFTPSSVQLGDERLDAAQLQEQFGGLVEPLLTSQRFCVAQYLPQALELTSVQVGDAQLVVVFAAQDAALGGAEFSTRGTCG